jgi:hypothetical protein
MTLNLIRVQSRDLSERLIVQDGEKEVLTLEWNDDLLTWMNEHDKEIHKGDINVFLEYARRRAKGEPLT